MKDFVSQCDVCLTHRDSQVREPILQHDVSPRPWAKIGADLCYFSGRVLLVVSDYFSNFIEVDSVSAENSKAVIRSLMAMFSRYGVPDSVVTDNGPCFASSEFSKFASQWNFQHVTSSPRYPQSNGKAENAVRTVKRLFTKCRAAGVSEFQALLDWRNTPSEGLDASPAQRFFGRRCKTLLPTTEALLRPRFSLATDAKKLRAQKEKQKKFYNRGKRSLAPLKPGEAVRVRSPRGTWKRGICLREVAPRSYDVQVDGEVRRRNRKDIWRANEQEMPLNDYEPPSQQLEEVAAESTVPLPSPEPVTQPPVTEPVAPVPVATPASLPLVAEPTPAPGSSGEQEIRRSTRRRNPPSYFKDYVMS